MKSKEENINTMNKIKSNLGSAFTEKGHTQKVKNVQSGKVVELEKKNTELVDEVSKLKDEMMRLFAEIENLKKRHKKDLESTAKYGVSSLLKDLTEPFEQLLWLFLYKFQKK